MYKIYMYSNTEGTFAFKKRRRIREEPKGFLQREFTCGFRKNLNEKKKTVVRNMTLLTFWFRNYFF